MAIYNVHAGHSLKCRGAAKYLDEVNENRKVKNKVIELLRAQGHTVYDCTDDAGTTANSNLAAIVTKCNAHNVALDVSIHLNAGGGTGVEVWNYNSGTKAISDRICQKISAALGIRNRGTKYNTGLYVLANTKAPALLVECCFVDSTTDKAKWNTDKCAQAIVEGILNKSLTPASSAPKTVKQVPGNPVCAENTICYRSHVAELGWLDPVRDGQVSGTTGAGYRLEALKIDVDNLKKKYKDAVVNVKAHIANEGWKTYANINSDTVIGTTGKKQAIEALEIEIQGLPAGKTFSFRTHLADYGWTGWIGNGYTSGTVGIKTQIEAIQMKIV